MRRVPWILVIAAALVAALLVSLNNKRQRDVVPASVEMPPPAPPPPLDVVQPDPSPLPMEPAPCVAPTPDPEVPTPEWTEQAAYEWRMCEERRRRAAPVTANPCAVDGPECRAEYADAVIRAWEAQAADRAARRSSDDNLQAGR